MPWSSCYLIIEFYKWPWHFCYITPPYRSECYHCCHVVLVAGQECIAIQRDIKAACARAVRRPSAKLMSPEWPEFVQCHVQTHLRPVSVKSVYCPIGVTLGLFDERHVSRNILTLKVICFVFRSERENSFGLNKKNLWEELSFFTNFQKSFVCL